MPEILRAKAKGELQVLLSQRTGFARTGGTSIYGERLRCGNSVWELKYSGILNFQRRRAQIGKFL